MQVIFLKVKDLGGRMYTGINGSAEFAYSPARLTVTGGSAAYIKYSNASVVLELCPFMFSSQK